MSQIDWSRYPLTAENRLARSLLKIEAALGHARNTIDAYARGREDFFDFCAREHYSPESVTKEHIALWVRDLTSRRHPRGGNVKILDSGAGLANATLQQRLTAVRLFFDYVIDKGYRRDNPIGRGRYTPGRGFAGHRDRALLPRYRKLPWIPNEEQWQSIIKAVARESLRNRLLFSLSYDAALRREEVCSLHISDFDFSHCLVTVRAEITKGRNTRVVPFSTSTATLLSSYLRARRAISLKPGAIFLSESRRNRGTPFTYWSWAKVVRQLALASGVHNLTPHTLRHLCLTDLARSGLDIHDISKFAGHRSIDTTMLYIHLSGRDIALKLKRGMDQIHRWRLSIMEKVLNEQTSTLHRDARD
jgi:site-specific recombinase XerD